MKGHMCITCHGEHQGLKLWQDPKWKFSLTNYAEIFTGHRHLFLTLDPA